MNECSFRHEHKWLNNGTGILSVCIGKVSSWQNPNYVSHMPQTGSGEELHQRTHAAGAGCPLLSGNNFCVSSSRIRRIEAESRKSVLKSLDTDQLLELDDFLARLRSGYRKMRVEPPHGISSHRLGEIHDAVNKVRQQLVRYLCGESL